MIYYGDFCQMNKETLEQIGLNESLIDIYKSVKLHGPVSIQNLSKILKKPRTTIHQNVSKLISKGLIYKSIEGNKKLLKASDPSVIKLLSQDKYKEIQKQKEELIDLKSLISQELTMLRSNGKYADLPQTRVEYYEGKEAVLRIHDQALESGEVRAYVDGSSVVKTNPNGKNFNKFWSAAESGKTEIWDIFMESNEIKDFIASNNGKLPAKYHIKFLPQDISIDAMDYLIFGESIAIIQGGSRPSVVHIKNKLLHDNAKALHKLMWRLL